MYYQAIVINKNIDWQWWCTPLIPALRRQGDLRKLGYGTRTAKTKQRNPVSKNKTKGNGIKIGTPINGIELKAQT